jgi:DNA polymerase-1
MDKFVKLENFTCRPERGGEPRCKLAELGCKTIEVCGFPFIDVYQHQQDDQAIPLSKSDSRPVWAPNQFDVMVIGEGPGHEEDKHGMPFQGRAGEILSDFLVNSGLDSNKIFITNTVRCRPPGNRKPTVGEMKACLPHLLREIQQIQPKVVLLLGNSALRLFKLHNEGGIMSIRGKVYERKIPEWEESPVFKVIPTLHPAAFLHRQKEDDAESKKLMNRCLDDYKLVGEVLRGGEAPPFYVPDWHLVDSFEKIDEMVEEIKQAKVFSFDTESAATPYTKEPLICISFCWGFPGKVGVLPWRQHDPRAPELIPKQHYDEIWLKNSFGANNAEKVIEKLRPIFEDSTIAKTAHNIKYDVNVLRYHLKIRTRGFFYDPMILHHLLDENPPHDLAFLADTEFKVGDYEAPRKKITGKGRKLINKFDKIPDAIMWPYTCTDAECTFRLMQAYYFRMAKIKPHLLKLYVEESEPGMHALAEAEWRGTLIDVDVTKALKTQAEEDQKKLLAEMRRVTKPDFNPLSNPQVTQTLKDLGFESQIEDRKAASGYSANKKRLNEIKDRVELAGQILEYRTNRKMISTYYDHALNDLEADGRIRHSFRQHGTVTGRLAASFLHQIKKIDERIVCDDHGDYCLVVKRFPDRLVMRDMFIAAPGYKYVCGDYSQVELRILAIIANDAELHRVFRDGDDLHAITTMEILKGVWKGEYTEEMGKKDKFNRSEIGKRVNFGLAYGSKGHSLVKTGKWKDWDGIERSISWGMLNEGMKNWNERFSGVGAFILNKPNDVRMRGNIATNCFGRERHLGGKLSSPEDYERGEAERECVNYFIQSAAGDLTNRTINEMHKHLQGHIESGNLDENAVYLVNTVHDSIAYEVREDLVPWFLEFFMHVATRPIPELNNTSFPFDLGVGNSWTEAEMAA